MNQINRLLVQDARVSERNLILSLIDNSFPIWVGKYLREILREEEK